ncbi:hypothetical protein [Arthrobacter monumenti]
MAGHRSFLDMLMRQTDKLQRLFGPADRDDPGSPVVHRHDSYEDASDKQLLDFDIESDTRGHHYAVRKSGKPWDV